jgi:Dyp-type peroxidase family
MPFRPFQARLKRLKQKFHGLKGELSQEAREDLQGLVLLDYKELRCACFLFLEIKDREGTKAWLAQLSEEITTAALLSAHGEERRNIALTPAGLIQLGVQQETLQTFPLEFREGMALRSQVLGDTGESAPRHWEFGGLTGKRRQQKLHILLMLHARTPQALRSLQEREEKRVQGRLRVLFTQDASRLPAEKEHFGFKDGVSQPAFKVAGERRDSPGEDTLPAGEFVLGYRNLYDRQPWSPSVPAEEDVCLTAEGTVGILAPHPEQGRKDLGLNGTYLVLRKLEQDVAGFWASLARRQQQDGTSLERGKVLALAAKLMGRDVDGELLPPDGRGKGQDAVSQEHPGFLHDDLEGRRCPFGAHARRANPRDALDLNVTTEDLERMSLWTRWACEREGRKARQLVNLHRLLRRSIPYGAPLVVGKELEGLQELFHGSEERKEEAASSRGLLFMAINANIGRQFEFVQQTWLNNTKLEGYYDEKDPIASGGEAPNRLTLPKEPFCQHEEGLQRHVTVKGGAYFFLPSKRTLKFLAACRLPRSRAAPKRAGAAAAPCASASPAS